MSPPPLADAMREAWVAMPDEERAELLLTVRDQYAILGPVRVDVLGVPVENESGVEMADRCRSTVPAEWSERELVFATALRLWRSSGMNFTELNQADFGLALLDDFFRAKRTRYLELLGRPDDTLALDLLAVTSSLTGLREDVERGYARCFAIDGGTWERREHFLPAESIAVGDIADDYALRLKERLGVALPEGDAWRERFAGLVEGMERRGVNPAEALATTADHVLQDERLDADYVVLTAPRGVKLEQPWTLELTDVFSYVSIHESCDPGTRGVRLDDVQIRTAIQQRMRYNVTCRGRNYSPRREDRLKAQPFQFPDIAIMEDAHHGGHVASGIRLVARAPFPVEVPSGQRWRGLADLRVNRVSYKEQDRYLFEDLPLLVRYSLWCKAIAEESYSRGLLLDEAYCGKQVVDRAQAMPGRQLSHA